MPIGATTHVAPIEPTWTAHTQHSRHFAANECDPVRDPRGARSGQGSGGPSPVSTRNTPSLSAGRASVSSQ